MAEPTVEKLYERRRPAFILAAGVIAIVSVVIARLPESLVNTLERNRFLDTSSAGWAYRLLAFFAIVQALYGGFFVLRVDHVKKARAEDQKAAAMTRAQVVTSLSRNAAGMLFLTLFYGLATFGITGQRGGFWLFPFLCLLQGLWYFREIGAVARWLGFQPDTAVEVIPEAVWKREPADYTPPIARSLSAIEIRLPGDEATAPNS